MKLIFFSPSGIDETLFQFHLAHVFASILGSTAAKSVIVLLAGTASTESEILSFLNEG